MSFLFGSSPSVQSVPITLQSSLNQPQTNAQSTLLQALQGGGSPSGNTFPQPNFPLTVNPSGLQNTSLSALQNLVTPTGGAASSGSITGAAPQAASTLEGILGGSPQDLQSYYNTNVFQPLNQSFQTQTLPSIASFFGGSLGGPQSSAAADAVGQATNNFENTLASTQGNLALQTAQNDISNKISAAGQIPQVANDPLSQLISLLGAGGTTTSLAQSNVGNQLQGFQDVAGQTQNILADLIGFLGTQTQTAANQPVAQPGTTGLLPSILAGLSGNPGVGSGLGKLLAGLGGG